MQLKSRIYKIVNTINNKIYIGQTVNFIKRKSEHFVKLSKSIHVNSYLQNTYNKYGVDAFIFKIIEECEINILTEREQFYIDSLKPEYNICKIAATTLGIKHTIEQNKAKSDRQKGKKKHENFGKIQHDRLKGIKPSDHCMEQAKIAATNRIHSQEEREKKRQSQLKRKERDGFINSPEARQKMKEASSIKVFVYDLNNNFIGEFESGKEAAKKLGISNTKISAVIKGNRKSTGGYKFYRELQINDIYSVIASESITNG